MKPTHQFRWTNALIYYAFSGSHCQSTAMPIHVIKTVRICIRHTGVACVSIEHVSALSIQEVRALVQNMYLHSACKRCVPYYISFSYTQQSSTMMLFYTQIKNLTPGCSFVESFKNQFIVLQIHLPPILTYCVQILLKSHQQLLITDHTEWAN